MPTTLDAMKKASEQLNATLDLYDIDNPELEPEADKLVKAYGDWSEDYLIPQVFFEYDTGTVEHVLTGSRLGVADTRKRIEQLFKSEKYLALVNSAEKMD
ncbi:MAG: hypothetical protein QXI37_00835 [Thermoprotei archaeon]